MDGNDPRIPRTSRSDPWHLGGAPWSWQEKVEHLEFVSLLVIHRL